jgi:hypothetical protein
MLYIGVKLDLSHNRKNISMGLIKIFGPKMEKGTGEGKK